MADKAAKSSSMPEVPAEDLQELVRLIGQVVSNMNLYGPGHKVVGQSLDTCYLGLDVVLDHAKTLTFALAEDALIVDGRELDVSNPLAAGFVRQLQAIGLGGFTLAKGIKQEEFGRLLDLLSKSPEHLKGLGGSFGEILQKQGITSVASTAVSYKRVADDDLVVNKGELAGQLMGAGKDEEAPATEEERRLVVDQIVAFLKGDVLPDKDKAADSLRDAANDPARLADLILKTAQVQQRAANLEGGESLADFVVGCIQKTYDALLDAPQARTQQGKKNLSKALMLLEKSILDKLRSMTVVTDNALAAISAAVEEIDSEVAIEAISNEYMKKRAALENTEAKVMRFLQKTEKRRPGTGDALREKLMEGGLTLDGWREIVAKSGSGGEGGGPGTGPSDGMKGVGMLAMLLSKLDELMGTLQGAGGDDRSKTEDLTRLVKEIDHEVNEAVARTERKVDDMVRTVANLEKIKDDAQAAREVPMEIAKWKDSLAEIVQELRQLVTVISSALEMIRSGRLGDVTRDQAEMLSLATSSSERLRHLTDRIFAISGVPVSMEPDVKLIRSLFK